MPAEQAWLEKWCKDDRSDQGRCYDLHVAIPALGVPSGRRGLQSYRCPVPEHADRKKKCSINAGTGGQWMVWRCWSEPACSIEAIRGALSDLGIDDDCLGGYARPGYRPPVIVRSASDPAEYASAIADQKRYHAVRKLPADLNGALLRMCIQAIDECDGEISSEPLALLPVNSDDFYALASRSGIERRYKYQLYKNWISAA